MTLQLTVDSRGLQQALAAGPAILSRHLGRAIGRIVQDMAREARRRAPKAFSTLTQSIAAVQPSPFEGLVVAGVDYARAVEQGTGPSGRQPPVRNILDWLKVRRLVADDPAMTQEDLAYVIARAIARKGTPAQPFMVPAFESNRARAEARIDQAIDLALREIGA